MIQTSRPIKFTCFLVVTLSLFISTMQANAGVRINLADDLAPGRHFLVTVTIYNRGFDSYHTEQLDNSFLTSGESKDTTVLAVIPFLYDRVTASAVHPCYYGDSTRSTKAPFALRTVTLPTLHPLSWRSILERGGPIKEGVTGLRFTLDLNSRISGKLDQGYSTFITVDLNPILGLKNNQRYFRKTYFNIYRNAEGNWKLK